ncbi:hypothetical protein [Erwinia tracheiphila]|nr:hypothetical protein [Erwinia tracheiphila]
MKRKLKNKIKEAAKLCGLRKRYYDSGSVAGFIVTSGGICQFQKRQ